MLNVNHFKAVAIFCLAPLLSGYMKLPVSSLDQETIEHYQFKEVGKARFSFLFWDIYDSQLYTQTGKFDNDSANYPTLLKINYLRDIDKEDLISKTIEQWEHLGFSASEYQKYQASLYALWPNIKAGDSLSLLVSSQASYFYHNQNLLGDIKHSDLSDKANVARQTPHFGELFLAIWLSPQTSQPKLRNQLLGLTP